MAEPQAPRRGAWIWPGWLPARPGGAWDSTSRPGRRPRQRPILLRGVELSADPLAHDLATSPDLDAKVAAQPRRGLFLTIDPETADPRVGLPPLVPDRDEQARCRRGIDDALADRKPSGWPSGAPRRARGTVALATLPLGDGVAADEPLGHALAAIDAQWVILAAPAVAGHEERLRGSPRSSAHFPPGTPSRPWPAAIRRTTGVAVRTPGRPDRRLSWRSPTIRPIPSGWPGVLDAPESARGRGSWAQPPARSPDRRAAAVSS